MTVQNNVQTFEVDPFSNDKSTVILQTMNNPLHLGLVSWGQTSWHHGDDDDEHFTAWQWVLKRKSWIHWACSRLVEVEPRLGWRWRWWCFRAWRCCSFRAWAPSTPWASHRISWASSTSLRRALCRTSASPSSETTPPTVSVCRYGVITSRDIYSGSGWTCRRCGLFLVRFD